MSYNKKKKVGIHTQKAIEVASHDYFVINDKSNNETVGLLIGTEVKKITEPVSQESKYWKTDFYWSVLVKCPNGETRKISVDVLTPREDSSLFQFQAQGFEKVS